MTIYEALKKDHDKVKVLLNELIALTDDSAPQRRGELVAAIRDELIPHSRAEEAVFYNCLRAVNSAKDIVMDGYSEHMEAEALLRTLQVEDKIDLKWKSTAEKLLKALTHHIQEEETKVFNVAQQLFTEEEAEIMAEAFEKLKPDVKKEGIVRTTLEMVTNMLPQRFVPSVKAWNLESRI